MARRRATEVHVNQERWLVSYADFITLLFAFFVVMYSISQVNQSKYRVLSETFDHAFNAPHPPNTDLSSSPFARTLDPFQVGELARAPDPQVIDTEQEATANNDSDSNSQAVDQLEEISNLFTERFADLINDDLVKVSSNELWLQIELKDSILFTSGNAEASLQAQTIFDEIATIMKAYPNPIQVEGYTDNVPISSTRYPSNWELSSARASAIVKILMNRGVAPQRLSAVGFGEFQPVATNQTAEGRAQNRRVALMIARKKMERPIAPINRAVNSSRKSVLPDNAENKDSTDKILPQQDSVQPTQNQLPSAQPNSNEDSQTIDRNSKTEAPSSQTLTLSKPIVTGALVNSVLTVSTAVTRAIQVIDTRVVLTSIPFVTVISANALA